MVLLFRVCGMVCECWGMSGGMFMTEKSKIGLTIIMVFGILALIVLIPRNGDKEAVVPATSEMAALVAEMQTNASSSAQAEEVVTQSDGSVIVRDKGASFKMAPVSSKQPVVVTEQEVRSRSAAK